MRVTGLWLLLIECFAAAILICILVKINKYLKILICIGLVGLFMVGGTIINLNSLPNSVQKKLDKVVDKCGSSYVKSEGNDIYIKINSKWVDLDDIAIIGTFTEDYTVEYDGEEIKLSDSGLKYTIKTLEYVGLLKNK